MRTHLIRGGTTAALFVLVALCPVLSGATIFVNFEGLLDSAHVTTQTPGLTFSHATVSTAGISLNEFEFPPHSGSNVAFDDGGPISILFATPAISLSGFFTYRSRLSLTAFNASNQTVATAQSASTSNLACLAGPPCLGIPGSTPNEFLQLSAPGGISRVVLAGTAGGTSFVLDDLTATLPTPSTPEPGAFVLMASGLAVLWIRKRS